MNPAALVTPPNYLIRVVLNKEELRTMGQATTAEK